jgi:hypothetical protein
MAAVTVEQQVFMLAAAAQVCILVMEATQALLQALLALLAMVVVVVVVMVLA